MAFNIIVLAKQVPDTRNVGKDAMKADGTVNRAALPAIFNPEDLNAMEQALDIKERFPGSRITVLTMGPGRAADILREGLFRGTDDGVLLTDRAFAGADTLATSYALSMAVRKIGAYDLIVAGDRLYGDTAPVASQVARSGYPTNYYAENIEEINKEEIQVKRRLDNGVESRGRLAVTCHSDYVNGSARTCRPRNATLLQSINMQDVTERQVQNLDYIDILQQPSLSEPTGWSVADVEAIGTMRSSGFPPK